MNWKEYTAEECDEEGKSFEPDVLPSDHTDILHGCGHIFEHPKEPCIICRKCHAVISFDDHRAGGDTDDIEFSVCETCLRKALEIDATVKGGAKEHTSRSQEHVDPKR